MEFQMLLFGECSTPRTMDSLCVLKCQRFRNIRHTETFEIPL
jgi:hypothetical protein